MPHHDQPCETWARDFRDLGEPPSNISGGLSVFSAFYSLSLYFEVARAEA